MFISFASDFAYKYAIYSMILSDFTASGTLVKDEDGIRRRVEEEHTTLLDQPSERYLGFATPKSGSGAQSTLDAILEHCSELGIDLSELNCCGCDGTNTNTGRLGGIIVLLEQKLQREIQRSICCLHRIELPFRHYFISLDGVTSGPKSFTGPIGMLAGSPVHTLPIRKFTPLDCELPEDLPEAVADKLGWDQKVLYRLVVAVKTGGFSICDCLNHLV